MGGPDYLQVHEAEQRAPIAEVWAVLDPASSGDGLVAIQTLNGYTLPLLTTREKNVPLIEDQARKLSASIGKPLVLAKFTNREDLKVIGGQ